MSKWEMVRLGNICCNLDSKRKPIKSSERKSGIFPYYGASGIIDYVLHYIFDEDLLLVSEDGANLLARSTPISFSVKGKVWVNNHAHVLKFDNMVTQRYVELYINHIDISKYVTGSAQPKLNQEKLNDLMIPLPPLDVQKHIADTLDKTQEIIDCYKKQLEELDNLIKATFYDMFGNLNINDKGWNYKSFSDVAVIDTKMTSDFNRYANLPHIGIDSIEKNTGEIVEYKLVKDSSLKSGKYYFNEQHIIYSKIRPNLNKVALPDFKGLCSADAYPILPRCEKINRYYLAHLLRSDYFLNYILSHSDRTNIPKVNKKQLESFNVIVPPIELQNNFANIVKNTDQQKTIVKQSISESQNLMSSLMSKYFD